MRKTYLAKLAQAGSVAAVAALAVIACGGGGDDGARRLASGAGGRDGADDTDKNDTEGTARAGAAGGGVSGGAGDGDKAGTGGSSSSTKAGACDLPTSTGSDPVLYTGVTPGVSCKTTIDSPYVGYWFNYDDGTLADAGLAKPMSMTAEKGGCQSDCAIHATGSGYTDYGAGIGFDVKDDASNNPTEFDATAFGGIQFSAKGTLTGTRGKDYAAIDNSVHLKLVTPTERNGDDYGGYCTIKKDWTLCQFPFADLTRDGFKNADLPTASDKLDYDKLLKVQLEFSRASDGPTPLGFDVWVDNVSFYGKPGITNGGGTEQLGEDVCKLSESEAPKSVAYTGTKSGGSCNTMTNTPYSTYWFKYADETTISDDPDAKAISMVGAVGGCQSDCAIHATGAGYKDYGAGIGFDLTASKAEFDGSQYKGVQFFAKGTLTGTRGKDYVPADNTIHLKIPTSTDRANDDYGAYCTIKDDEWTKCRLDFDTLSRDGFADNDAHPVAGDTFDRDKMMKLQLEFSRYSPEGETTKTPITFDVWVDNVSFY